MPKRACEAASAIRDARGGHHEGVRSVTTSRSAGPFIAKDVDWGCLEGCLEVGWFGDARVLKPVAAAVEA